ncbi:MAG TPA: MBL fold metallo-hydrolase, partial [Acidimicrobiia bacterium]|nr:MBL fold metallo-hydrolase [Acidimicrobiia bacterium]
MPGEAHLTFYGVRGSTPCDGARYERYGGNTSCVALESPGHDPIVFDLGTGLRVYGDVVTKQFAADLSGNRFTSPYRATVLLTHLHWDHIIGFPFFTPVFRPDAVVDIYGPRQEEGLLADVFAGVMRPPYFPITPGDLGGTANFVDTDKDEFAVNGAKVRARWVRHTDPTLGFRVEQEGAAVAYMSDHGPGCAPDDADDFIPNDILELCDGVDVLIHDAQHTVHEYEAKRHFGHSTIDYAVHVAREAGVKTLALFHHCPSHSDADIDEIVAHARDLSAETNGPEVIGANEGLRLTVG